MERCCGTKGTNTDLCSIRSVLDYLKIRYFFCALMNAQVNYAAVHDCTQRSH